MKKEITGIEKSKTVEVPVVWFEGLISHAQKVKPEILQYDLIYLLGYIENAKSIINR